MASALGFSVAYYFDPESGGLRRKPLQHAVRARSSDTATMRWRPTSTIRPSCLPVLRSHRRFWFRPVTKRVGAAR